MTRTMRSGGLAAALCFSALTVAAAPAPEPSGTWLTEGGKATVRLAPCGPAVCGTIIALKEPTDAATGRPLTDKNNPDAGARNKPMIGLQIVLGMRPSGTPNKWSGQVYNAEDGKTYSGSLTLQNANTIRLEGCVLGGLFCKAQTWTRSGNPGGRA